MGVVVIGLIALGYYLFFGRTTPTPAPSSDNGSLTTSAGAPVSGIINADKPMAEIEAAKIGQEFINQLLSLQAIKLDDEIFSSLSFQSLEDFTIVLIQSGNEGRPNPFAPFGADGVDPSSSMVPSVSEGGPNVTPVGGNTNWTIVTISGNNISYDPTWTATAIPANINQQGIATTLPGYEFTLQGGAKIVIGGAQSSCLPNDFGTFTYGVSTTKCVRNLRADLVGPAQAITQATKNAFGDFVIKNGS